MKKVPVSGGRVFAIVDDEDYDFASSYTWGLAGSGYVQRKKSKTVNGKRVYTVNYLHRDIMNAKKGQEVDHINHNPLDCRKENMRLCSRAENCRNSRGNKNKKSSQYKGVSIYRKTGTWRSFIWFENKPIWLGNYKSEQDAAIAYNNAATRLHGEFAVLNEVIS